MPTKEIDAAIKALEIQVRHYENLLDQSIRNNEILSQVKVIYHDLKKVSEKLRELKKLQETNDSKN
jgi:tRNA1(Val) A37 N6-methylase TrmN6